MDHLQDDGEKELEARLLGATAKIAWQELQRFHARGRVIEVATGLDLLQVAQRLIADDAAQFQQWIADGQVQHVSDSTALRWVDTDVQVWATVVAPWVLVQESAANGDADTTVH